MQGYLFISFPAYFLVNFYEHIIHFYQTTIDKISIVTYQTKRKKDNDPEPDVPKDVTPMAQCAFESLVFNVSAVYTN